MYNVQCTMYNVQCTMYIVHAYIKVYLTSRNIYIYTFYSVSYDVMHMLSRCIYHNYTLPIIIGYIYI